MTLLLMVGERSLLTDTGDSTSGEPPIAPNEEREGSLVEEGGGSVRTLPTTSCYKYNTELNIERYSNKKVCSNQLYTYTIDSSPWEIKIANWTSVATCEHVVLKS